MKLEFSHSFIMNVVPTGYLCGVIYNNNKKSFLGVFTTEEDANRRAKQISETLDIPHKQLRSLTLNKYQYPLNPHKIAANWYAFAALLDDSESHSSSLAERMFSALKVK